MSGQFDGQFSFADALITVRPGQQRLDKLLSVVRWYRFEKLLAKLKPETGTASGRPSYPALMMFKALLLQSLYGLSDSELEEALYDRLSFRRFAGLALDGAVPDHSTLCRFRNRLVEAGILERLFVELDRQLDDAGLILRRGTMLDATVIETSAVRPPKDRVREGGKDASSPEPDNAAPQAGAKTCADPDAAFTRRKGRSGSAYGYKAHVGVDEGSGLIRRVITTPANVNDTVPADQLICGDEARVLADAAYHTHAREAALKARGIRCGLMRRPNKHHPKLAPGARRFNRMISGPRAAVETTFATLKHRMGLATIRYRGLAKAEAQVLIAVIAFNMRRWVTLTG
jgi:IS5 family transposase